MAGHGEVPFGLVTYHELGERLKVDICTGCSLTHHEKGFWAGGRFHWNERALRRTSIRNFVWRLSAQQVVARVPAPAWLRYWRRVEWSKDALRKLHVRLPASAWDQQRATLRAMLVDRAGAGIFFDDVFSEERQVTRKAAIRWAKKPVEQGAAGEYDD